MNTTETTTIETTETTETTETQWVFRAPHYPRATALGQALECEPVESRLTGPREEVIRDLEAWYSPEPLPEGWTLDLIQ